MYDDFLRELRENLVDLTEQQEAIEQLNAQGLELGSQQRDLAEQVDLQKENAVSILQDDYEALKTQLSVAFNSRNRPILAALPQQKWALWSPISLSTAATNPNTQACQDIIKQYDLLNKLATQANKRLNGVYIEFLETEDELEALAKELEELEEELTKLEGIEEMSDEIQEKLEDLAELAEETEMEVEKTWTEHIKWQEFKRHEQKKSRWLWAVAPLTGGLSLPLALRASHHKRVSRRLRDSTASDVCNLRAHIEELKVFQEELAPYVEKLYDTTKKLENVRILAGETTRKNLNLRELVSQQCDQFRGLKEKSTIMVSQTRSLEARVKTLTFAEGADEVEKVMKGLDNEWKQINLILISDFV